METPLVKKQRELSEGLEKLRAILRTDPVAHSFDTSSMALRLFSRGVRVVETPGGDLAQMAWRSLGGE